MRVAARGALSMGPLVATGTFSKIQKLIEIDDCWRDGAEVGDGGDGRAY